MRLTHCLAATVVTCALGVLTAPGLSAQSANADAERTTSGAQFRVVLGVGAMYIHRPAFTYSRGAPNPQTFTERETDGGGVLLGGGLEAIAARWWGGLGAHVLLPVFDNGTSIIASAHGGPTLPRVLGGRVRIGMGPVLVRSTRRERGLLSGLCFDNCRPVVYPADLTTGGVGVVLVSEWKPWSDIGLGFDGQLASGAQRFATGRIRLSLGN